MKIIIYCSDPKNKIYTVDWKINIYDTEPFSKTLETKRYTINLNSPKTQMQLKRKCIR